MFLLATVLLALPSAALAARAHEFKEAFGEPCIAEPCTGAQLKEPDGVAVSEATGDVYVVDKGARRVVRFSEAGAPLGEVTGPGASGSGTLAEGSSTIESAIATTGAFSPGEEVTAPGLAPGTTITAVNGGALEVSNPVEAGKSGVAVELKAQLRFETPETIAVDDSCVLRKLTEPKCKEADPSSGDVYVVDEGLEAKGHRAIDKFSAEGEYLGQITDGEEPRFKRALDGVAVDEEGAVSIYQETRTINKYANEASNKFTGTVQVELGCCGAPGFAVDSEGSFYVNHSNGSPATRRIAKVDAAGKVLNGEVDGELSSAVAVEAGSDDSFIDNLSTIAVFDPAGTLLERFGEEGGEGHLSQGAGIGVNASTDSVYVADAASGEVAIFGPQSPSSPKIESESFADVSSTGASLGARINPRSEPGEAPSSYRFEYGRCAGVDPASCPGSGYEASVPVPEGQIKADFEVHEVGAGVTGLQPSATYHFRAIASNSHGEGPPGEEVTFTTQSAGGELALPDDRGWELVSPPDKQGALIAPITEGGVVQAAASGTGITYLANAPTEEQPQGYTNRVQVLSSRGPAAWSSQDITVPHPAATGISLTSSVVEEKFFDSELGTDAVQPFGQFNPGLSEEASEPTAYLHDLRPGCATHCFRPLVTGKAGFANVPEGTIFGDEEACEPKSGAVAHPVCGPEFIDASDDLSHVVVRSEVALRGGGGKAGLYEWSGGSLAQVNLLPGGEAAPQSTIGLDSQATRRAISTDGSRVVWSTSEHLYSRNMARGETLALDEAEAGCGTCDSGGGRFQVASADGSRVLFRDTRRLTSDSGGGDLYECRIGLSAGKLSCSLTDLTPAHGGEAAAVQGGVLGASEDGSYVYFVAMGVQGEAPNARGQSPVAGQPNLYLSHDGAITFIATLSGGDEHDWSEALASQPTRVSGNGRFLELMSQGSPTGYDNRDAKSGAPVAEVYIYDAANNRLRCASCEPSGVRPTGVAYKQLEPGSGGLVGGPSDLWPAAGLVGANVPGWTSMAVGAGLKERHQPRYLSDSGRLFFDTAGALVPQDANGTQDVYEYEPPGVGGCSEASATFSTRSGGCVALISSGGSAQESAFLDASESGDDVFFLTAAKLSTLDTDTAFDVYDAHRCTSAAPCITFPEEVSPPCTTEASCKAPPTPQPSIFGAPASATFSGPGNQAPAAPSGPKVKTPEEIRAEHLKKALKACRAKKGKHKHKACEVQARKKYVTKARAKKAHHAKGGSRR